MSDEYGTGRRTGYELGWNDGYTEGYAVKLVDVTEPFMPTEENFNIEKAARWFQTKYSVAFPTYSDAIGAVRGILKAGKP